MLNITNLAEELREETEWQETPMPLTTAQYIKMVVRGIERLFVDTGRAAEYNEDLYRTDSLKPDEDSEEGSEENSEGGSDSSSDDSSGESSESYFVYDADFLLDEKLYIKICARMNFFQKVQSDVNNTFGYSTDALTVTNADKPYANLRDTIEKLDNERRIIYYKMVRYTLGGA